MGTVVACTSCYANGKHRLLMINLVNLLMLWYLGMRSSMVFALLGLIVICVSRRGHRAVIGNWKLGFSTIVMAIVVLCYKKVYVFIKLGDWSSVAATTGRDGFLTDALLNSEAMSQTHILNAVI